MKKSKKIAIIIISIILAVIIAFVAAKVIKSKKYEKGLAELSAKTEAELNEKYGVILDEVPENMRTEKISCASAFASGDGTQANPYQISTAEELMLFAENINNSVSGAEKAFYELTNDIYLNDIADCASWSEKAPKYGWDGVKSFSGSFNGNGHTIYGLFMASIIKDASSQVAFIMKATDATIKNLSISDGYIYAYNNAGDIGGIVGNITDSTLTDCNANVTISCRRPQSGSMGGVAGSVILTEVKNCTSNGNVTCVGAMNIGGVFGSISTYYMDSCTNNGEVIGKEAAVAGGVVGSLSDTFCKSGYAEEKPDNLVNKNYKAYDTCTYSNLVNNGTVLSVEGDAAGIAGTLSIDRTVANCTGFINNGTIKINSNENDKATSGAGIIGRLSCGYDYISVDKPKDSVGTLTLSNVENKGDIVNNFNEASATLFVGGIVSTVNMKDKGDCHMENCKNSGKFSENMQAGGIAGKIAADGASKIEVVGCVNESDILTEIIGVGSIGGIVASTTISPLSDGGKGSIKILNCTNNGNLKNGRDTVGGIVGTHSVVLSKADKEAKLEISGCTNNGQLSAEYFAHIGGVVGSVTANHIVNIENNKNFGDIVVKVNKTEDNDHLEDCSQAGGIVGKCEDSFTIAGNENHGNITVDGNKTYVYINDKK